MLKIAAILMVAVLLTTCAISSTFAKYVTTAQGSDTARIAKFGLVATTTVDGFNTTYATKAGAATDTSITNSVVSSDDDKLIAPGTTRAINTALSATGTAEVAVRVVSEFVFDYEGFSDTYFPIYFTIGTETFKHKSIDKNSTLPVDIDEFLAKVAEKLTITEEFAPKTTVAIDEATALTWTWDYEQANQEDGDDNGILDFDEKDNALVVANATFDVIVNTTITQID